MNLIVGRQTEQAELNKILLDFSHGSGGIVLISGEAGVGKTTLVESVIQHSERRILHGRTFEVSTPPFGPIVQVIREGIQQQPDVVDCDVMLLFSLSRFVSVSFIIRRKKEQQQQKASWCVFFFVVEPTNVTLYSSHNENWRASVTITKSINIQKRIRLGMTYSLTTFFAQ